MAGAERQGDVFDLERLGQLIELMKEHGLTEVDLQQDEQKIRLSRAALGAVSAPLPTVTLQPTETTNATPQASDGPHIVTINSPMVGTFFSKPNPESDVFVRVGDPVGKDSIVCIIEAMKVFNEIPAEVSGKIVAVLVDNEESVDFGKPLFKVDTSA